MNVKTDNGIKLEGFISIELINKKDRTKRVYKNTITNAGKQFLLDKCVQSMLSMAPDLFGKALASGAITRKSYSDSASNVTGRVSSQDRDITNALLNVGEETTLNANTTFVNVFDADFVEASKLVGYANSNIAPVSNGKEGTLDYCKGEYVVDPFTVAKRWKYPEGVASGTIDTVAMVPAGTVKYNNADGIRFMKCLDKVNTQAASFVSQSTGFLPPGITGFTANDEILLNFDQDGNTRWKYSLTTGEITAVDPADPFFVVLGYDDSAYQPLCTDILKDGNYLYVLRVSGRGGDASNTSLGLTVYDLTSGNTPSQLTEVTVKTGYDTYVAAAKFLKIGNQVYVTTIGTNEATAAAPKKLFTLSKGSKQYWSSFGSGDTDFSAIGVTVPSGLNINNIGFGNYGSQYVMYQYAPLAGVAVGSGATVGHKMRGLVYGSLSNLDPSNASGCLFGVNPNTIAWSAGSNSGLLQVGFDYSCVFPGSDEHNLGEQQYDLFDAIFRVTNTSGTKDGNLMYGGVYLSLDGWWTNVISFVRLQTPIVKGDDDIMYVSYGYKVV